ncbi:MAG: cyclase family protein [Candidatus Sumerlaeaceae bacterium]
MSWLEITLPIRSGMLRWPGDPEVKVTRTSDISRGEVCNVSHISMGTHTGTHIDPPLHFFEDGKSMDTWPLELGIGPARVIHIKNPECINADELRKHAPKTGERILFRTRNSDVGFDEEFRKDFVYVAADAAQLLADSKVALVGIDYMSIGGFYMDGEETHRILLGAGIWVIENLNLASITAGNYELLCLPLRIDNGDGAPCRALLRPL